MELGGLEVKEEELKKGEKARDKCLELLEVQWLAGKLFSV